MWELKTTLQRTHFALAVLIFIFTFATAICSAQSEPQTPGSRENPRVRTSCAAQSQPNAPSTAQPPNRNQTENNQNKEPLENGTSNDRLFYTLPNFLTLENAGKVPPLTSRQKFKVVGRESFDYVQIPWYAFLAGINQAENSERGYGQGVAGYGKRFGAYFADGAIESFMTGAILPSILREDPRYFQSGQGGFWTRTGYAVSRIFVTRTDAGNNRFNASEVVGAALSAGISTYSYHPREDRSLANTASVWGSLLGYDTLTQVAREFWPDIRRKLQKKRQAP